MAERTPPGRTVGMGLIGLGLINRAHVMGYQQSDGPARIAAVCDANAALAQQRAAELGCAAYSSYTELLADREVEAVDITLPHHLHYEVARAALEHGKHVLVEKPMASTSQECRALIELAQARGLTLTVAENTRFVAAYQAAEALLRAGSLGELRLVRTFIYGSEVERLRDTANWKGRLAGSRGGTIIDAGPHSFYLLTWLCGQIASVQAVQSQLVAESEVEDHAIVSGSLANGAVFSTEYSFTAEIPWGERCEIYGSAGSLIIDQLHNPPAVWYRGARDYAGEALPGVAFEPQRWKLLSIMAGVRDFAEAIARGRPPAINPWDGYEALRVVEAAYASVAGGGRLVRL